jgi:hypothetical protein
MAPAPDLVSLVEIGFAVDRGRGLTVHVLEEDVSCSQYAAAVSPLTRQATTCFFHVAASAIHCTGLP